MQEKSSQISIKSNYQIFKTISQVAANDYSRNATNLDDKLKKMIHEANRRLYTFELHNSEPTDYQSENSDEQKRLFCMLSLVDRFILSNQREALDFGAGTGNLTGKLLQMGYCVTAVDISSSNCKALNRRYRKYVASARLKIINSPIEETDFAMNQFDLVCCYAVLHHLPDYIETIKSLIPPLKNGGIMYLDNEASPYESLKRLSLKHILKTAYQLPNDIRAKLSISSKTASANKLDLILFDYWRSQNRRIDHDKIKKIFEEQHFTYFKRFDYESSPNLYFKLLTRVYRLIFKPDMSCWIAKK